MPGTGVEFCFLKDFFIVYRTSKCQFYQPSKYVTCDFFLVIHPYFLTLNLMLPEVLRVENDVQWLLFLQIVLGELGVSLLQRTMI